MTSIKSPWGATFDEFAGSIRESAMIAAPFVTSRPVERLIDKLGRRRKSVRLEVLTSLRPDRLIDGTLDADALFRLCEDVPGTSVRHLLHLHAKAYVADDHTAIVTSANLTNGGIWRNHELGVSITDPTGVKDIVDDLREYGSLGVPIPCEELAGLGNLVQQSRASGATADSPSPSGAQARRTDLYQAINERLIGLRTAGQEFISDPGGSVTAQFAEAVLYVLRRHGAMPTSELNPLVRNLKPELCDDEVDRVIGGRAFDKRWKHDIRNAQQQLKREGRIVLDGRKWRLTEAD